MKMEKNVFKLFLSISILFALILGMSFYQTKAQQTANIQLTIQSWTITIGVTGDLDFGAFNVSSAIQTGEQQFSGDLDQYFWVEDMVGEDVGYYTTVSLTNLTGQATSSYIPNSNVSIKVDTAATTLVAGNVNTNVVVDNTLLSYQAFDSIYTFIKRDNAANAGKVGKYAAHPRLKIAIPAYQTVDTYQGILTYTLYVN